MVASPLFAPGFRTYPYWWERTPPTEMPEQRLPPRADVIVIGSGYTGLHAALQLARGGRATLVVDAETAGWGCSTRNGGQVGTSIKPGFAALARMHGEARARRIIEEGYRSLAWLGEFIGDEAIECDFRVCGRIHAAHSARQFQGLVELVKNPHGGIDPAADLVPRDAQHREVGTEVYYGGILYRRHAALDPARYHRAILELVLAAGAQVIPHCRVMRIARHGSGFRVTTECGVTDTRDVVIATNGYTGKATPWLRRRLISIGSYIIATELLPREVIDELLPTDRMVTDTRRVVYYYRASPDRTRILFGGRVAWNETDAKVSAPLLHAELVRIFPQLVGIRITHSWMGFVAYTFDALMHSGTEDGVHYAAGYCGSGVGMASYLGMKAGLKVLGDSEGATAFDGLPFPSRPYYRGYPWFLAPAIGWYRWLDRIS